MSRMPLVILRGIFLMVAVSLGTGVMSSIVSTGPNLFMPAAVVFVSIIALAGLVIAADVFSKRKELTTISSVYFGMMVGLVLSYAASLTLTPLIAGWRYQNTLTLGLTATLCYVCVSLLLQTRNDFRFIIPYVEFSKQVKGTMPYILDTSVIIDGRIADFVETKILDAPLIFPAVALNELQTIADSSDRLRRSRGRRGLDILNRLRANPDIELQIYDREIPDADGQPVDLKLVLLAKHLNGKVVTNDFNFNKVAKLHGVEVVNLNEVTNALKPVFLPGESMEIRIIKAGESHGQGVGHLNDGTMVVVEGGRDHIGQNVKVLVTSMLQTNAGRMIFAKYESLVGAPTAPVS